MSDSGSAMLRQVRYKSVLQDADRLRNPRAYDRFETLARIVNMADQFTAQEALLDWLEETVNVHQRRKAEPEDWQNLRALYKELKGRIGGRMLVMPTELGYYSQNVAADYDRTTYPFDKWASPSQLRALFKEGRELLIFGHMDAGKTHLLLLMMERILLFNRQYVVATNIPGIHAKVGAEDADQDAVNLALAARVTYVVKVSGIMRVYAKSPVGTPILVGIDEPEAFLRSGPRNKARDNWNNFRYCTRKLRIRKAEIWHTKGEVYRELREETSDHIAIIEKDDQDTFDLVQQKQDGKSVRRIEDVPALRHLDYATRGFASIEVDLDFKQVNRYLRDCHEEADMKRAVARALNDPKCYLPDYRDEIAPLDEGMDDAAREEAVFEQVVANPMTYLGPRGGWDAPLIASNFGVTHRQAQTIARRAKAEWEPRLPY